MYDKLLLVILLLLMSAAAQAEWSGSKKIKTLKAHSAGIYLTLDGFANESAEVQCDYSSFQMEESGDNNYQARVSFLISAYLSGTPVNISYYGCSGSHLSLGSVELSG